METNTKSRRINLIINRLNNYDIINLELIELNFIRGNKPSLKAKVSELMI